MKHALTLRYLSVMAGVILICGSVLARAWELGSFDNRAASPDDTLPHLFDSAILGDDSQNRVLGDSNGTMTHWQAVAVNHGAFGNQGGFLMQMPNGKILVGGIVGRKRLPSNGLGLVIVVRLLANPEITGHGTVVVRNGRMTLNVAIGGNTYIAQNVTDLHHIVEVHNTTGMPGPVHRATPPPTPPAKPNPPRIGPSDDGSQIDVLVLYTRGAVTAAGGTENLKRLVEGGVVMANHVLGNSNVHTALHVVGYKRVPYTGEPFAWYRVLSDMLHESNGLSGLVDLRNSHAADVTLLVGNGWSRPNPICGIAYEMRLASVSQAPHALGALDTNCLRVAPEVMIHELGHMMGAGHNPEEGSGLFSDSKAYYVNPWFHTVMVTNPSRYCPNCRLALTFSNPSWSFSGVPTGVTGLANNARVVRMAAPIVAQYRQSSTRQDHFTPCVKDGTCGKDIIIDNGLDWNSRH